MNRGMISDTILVQTTPAASPRLHTCACLTPFNQIWLHSQLLFVFVCLFLAWLAGLTLTEEEYTLSVPEQQSCYVPKYV